MHTEQQHLQQPNFYSLISDKTKDFVGRKWVFDEIDNWLSDDSQNTPKYFIVTGKAGSGKSTISARLIEISNGDIEPNNPMDNDVNIYSTFKKLKKGFLDASYIISFKDNLSTDAKSLAKSISSQLASKYDEFAQELINLTKTSNFYKIDINAPQQQIDAQSVSGGNYVINISGSPPALSVFNDLVRNPLESFLKKNPQKKMVFLIDGLDESVTSSKNESYSDSIISILSNLDGLENVYFMLTTRDYENILNKFKNNSFILDISSKRYIS
jgi:KAP family P-loop domain